MWLWLTEAFHSADKLITERRLVDFVLFDVLVDDWWLRRRDVVEIADMLGIQYVPEIGVGKIADALDMVREGLNSEWGDFPAEGIVMRPYVELKNRDGKRIVAKIKHKDFVQLHKASNNEPHMPTLFR